MTAADISARLAAINRSAWYEPVMNKYLVMLNAIPIDVAAETVASPYITPEYDGGVGLWWKSPGGKRELDLDCDADGAWRAILTHDIEAVRAAKTTADLDALVIAEGDVTDARVAEFARWLVGCAPWPPVASSSNKTSTENGGAVKYIVANPLDKGSPMRLH